MPSQGTPPAISIPWYMALILIAWAPAALIYDRYKIWKWQRIKNR